MAEDRLEHIARSDLPLLTTGKAEAIVQAINELLLQEGGIALDKDTPAAKANKRATSARGAFRPEFVASAVAAILNDDLHYDSYIRIGLAIKGALGEAGRSVFHGFASRSSKYNVDTTNQHWDSFEPHSIGAGTIFYLALQNGWAWPLESPNVPAHYPRPHMTADWAGRRLAQILPGLFNRVMAIKACRVELEEARREMHLTPADLARVEAELLRINRLRTLDPPRVQIPGSAGLGKTSRLLREYARNPALWGLQLELYVPDLDLAASLVSDLERAIAEMPDIAREVERRKKLNLPYPRALLIKGREHGLKAGEAKCNRAARLKQVAGKVQSVYASFCRDGKRTCPHYEGCAYLEQFADSGPALRIQAHARLGLQQPENLALPTPDIIFVDEKCFGALIETPAAVSPKFLGSWKAYGRSMTDEALECADLGSRLGRVLWDYGADLPAIRNAGITAEKLRLAASAAESITDWLDLWPGAPDEVIQHEAEKFSPNRSRDVARLLRRLIADLEAGKLKSNGVEVAGDDDPDHAGRFLCHSIRKVGIPETAALCIIDADARLSINKTIFGPLKEFPLPAMRQGRFLQCYSTSMPKSTLRRRGAEMEKVRQLVQRKSTEQVRDWHTGAMRRRRIALFTTKEVRRLMTGESDGPLPPFVDWEGAQVGHFGFLLGRNDWKDFDTVIVVGREQPPALAMERQARAIYADADVAIEFTGEYRVETRGYDLRSGQMAGAGVQCHPDPLVQEILEQAREASSAQALDRLRLIHPVDGRNPEVIILCNIPLPGVTADHLATLDDICEMPVLRRAFLGSPGALALTPEVLARYSPNLFSSEEGAKSTIRREANERVKLPIISTGELTLSNFRAKRVPGIRGGVAKWSLAAMAVDAPILRALVQRQMRKPLEWSEPCPEEISASGHVLASCRPGDRFITRYREVGRIGTAGWPMPPGHYTMDDADYPSKTSPGGPLHDEWQRWGKWLIDSPELQLVAEADRGPKLRTRRLSRATWGSPPRPAAG